jgi:MarR family transcriptional regulator, organic hydroperoxide resistance regulator
MAKARARATSNAVEETESVPSPVPLGRVLGFMRLLWAVDHGLTQVSKRMHSSIGVTGPQRLVIRLAGQSPGLSAGALAATLHLHPSTMTGILKRLQASGFLERSADPLDGRRAVLRLTKKGERLDLIRAGTVEARVRVALTGVSDHDLAAAERVLTRITASMSGKT